jgi:hypothetical protein
LGGDTAALDEFLECLSFEQLHDHELGANFQSGMSFFVEFAVVVYADVVGVLKKVEYLDFSFEAFDDICIHHVFVELDGDFSAECPSLILLDSSVDFAHSSAAEIFSGAIDGIPPRDISSAKLACQCAVTATALATCCLKYLMHLAMPVCAQIDRLEALVAVEAIGCCKLVWVCVMTPRASYHRYLRSCVAVPGELIVEAKRNRIILRVSRFLVKGS